MDTKWTIQGKRENAMMPLREFETKREAVNAMNADRQPKTEIQRFGRHYLFTFKQA